MKNKKMGFTVIELILSITLTVVILAIMFNLFILSKKIFTSVDVKSSLQSEAQTTSDKINSIGMSAIKIEDIVPVNEDIPITTGANINIKQITLVAKEEVNTLKETNLATTKEVSYIIKYDSTNTGEETNSTGMLYIKKDKEPDEPIAKNVESISIKSGNSLANLYKSDSIELNIKFAKKKGFSNIEYSVPINVAFRNKQ